MDIKDEWEAITRSKIDAHLDDRLNINICFHLLIPAKNGSTYVALSQPTPNFIHQIKTKIIPKCLVANWRFHSTTKVHQVYIRMSVKPYSQI